MASTLLRTLDLQDLLHANWINWMPLLRLKTSIDQAIILSCSRESEKGNGAFASMLSGGFVSGGPNIAQGPQMSKLWIIARIEETGYARTYSSR